MKVLTLTVGSLSTNCYILYCESTLESAVIDPGADGQRIIEEVSSRNLNVRYIVLTHGHFDHIGALRYVKENTGAKIAVHEEDAKLLTDSHKNLSFLIGQSCIQPAADILLKDGDELMIGEVSCKIVHTPGHTNGSICIVLPGIVFTGDTLFRGSVGRTDLSGDFNQLMHSIKTRLMKLEDDYIVYPGHGEPTTIGRERHYIEYGGLND